MKKKEIYCMSNNCGDLAVDTNNAGEPVCKKCFRYVQIMNMEEER